jgi:hypothetical protein
VPGRIRYQLLIAGFHGICHGLAATYQGKWLQLFRLRSDKLIADGRNLNGEYELPLDSLGVNALGSGCAG